MTIKIDKCGFRIKVQSDVELPGLKNVIPGAYQAVAGHWTVPLSLESCKLLRERYGGALRIGDELKRWARCQRDSRDSMASLAAEHDVRLHVVPKRAPLLAAAMNARPYQRVGAKFIAENRASLLADDPGLGKTLIAMAGIIEAQVPGPYLVVAPKTAAETVWEREISRWLPARHKAVTLPQLRFEREYVLDTTRYGKYTWLIVHPEIVMVQSLWVCETCKQVTPASNYQKRELPCGHIKTRKTKRLLEHNYPKLFSIKWGVVVVDESHESLIRRAGKPTQRRLGLELLPIREDGLKIAMSGTPFDSKPHQLWGTLNWLDPGTYNAFHRWSELYWQKGGYTGFVLGEFRQDREQMLWDSLSGVALRRTKAEVANDLPPKMEIGSRLDPTDADSPVGIWLEMNGKQRDAYNAMETLSIAQLDSGRLEALTALAELTRLKQLASSYGDILPKQLTNGETRYQYVPKLPSNKFDWIVANLEEWGYPHNPLTKVVIVSFYTGILDVFAQGIERHFKTKPGKPLCTGITGKTPQQDRCTIIDRFNREGNEQIMFLNVKAGGTAITIDSADRMIFVSETRIPDQQKQAEDRIHRVSNPRQCMYYYLRSLDTVDVGTAFANQEAIRDTHRLLDARRGVSYFRHVLDKS